MTERSCASLCEALIRAVRDIRPVAQAVDTENLAHELERRISYYWGQDHGITREEIIATARDIQTATTAP